MADATVAAAPTPMVKPMAQTSVTTTATTSLGTVGGLGVVKWIVLCFVTGGLVAPSDDVLGFMVAAVAPLCHLFYKRLAQWISGPLPAATGESR